MTRTERFISFARNAAAVPAGPPPTTMTSITSGSFTLFLVTSEPCCVRCSRTSSERGCMRRRLLQHGCRVSGSAAGVLGKLEEGYADPAELESVDAELGGSLEAARP